MVSERLEVFEASRRAASAPVAAAKEWTSITARVYRDNLYSNPNACFALSIDHDLKRPRKV
jgi:hypothetical protein